jgi:hypothetical protein
MMPKVTRYTIDVPSQIWNATSPENAKSIISFMIDNGMLFSVTRVQIPSGEIKK